jgi:hypothetical protein
MGDQEPPPPRQRRARPFDLSGGLLRFPRTPPRSTAYTAADTLIPPKLAKRAYFILHFKEMRFAAAAPPSNVRAITITRTPILY